MNKKTCPNCKELVEDNEFCSKCGIKLNTKKNHYFIKFLAICFTIFFVFYAISYFDGVEQKEKVKKYLVETHGFNKKDIKIISSTSYIGLKIISLGTEDEKSYKIEYHGIEFRVTEKDFGLPTMTISDDYEASKIYQENIHALQIEINNTISKNNIDGFAVVDENYPKNGNKLYYTILVFESTPEEIDNLEFAISETITKYISEINITSSFEYIVFKSKDYYNSIKNFDFEEYFNSDPFNHFSVDPMINKILNKEIVPLKNIEEATNEENIIKRKYCFVYLHDGEYKPGKWYYNELKDIENS